MGIQHWERLSCECKGEKFIRLSHIKWQATGGSTDEPGGWQCSSCGKEVDHAKLIASAKLRQKQKELSELQSQIQSGEVTL